MRINCTAVEAFTCAPSMLARNVCIANLIRKIRLPYQSSHNSGGLSMSPALAREVNVG